MPEPDTVAVVGFGLMGAQISQVFAQKGYAVKAYDVSASQLEKGLDLIRNGKYGLDSAVAKGRISAEEANEIISRIHRTTTLQDCLSGTSFVLEAAIETLETKREIFKSAAKLSAPGSVLASNTSTLSITQISNQLTQEAKKRIVGMHFFNPPQIMKLVEVVTTSETSDEIVEKTRSTAATLGKIPILVHDIPGFVANRIGISVFAEASNLLEKGVSTVRDIDLAMRLGYGYPMGPFELGDLVGLDTRLRNMEALYSETKEEKFRPPSILRTLVSEGYLGDPRVKNGSKGGYYEYFHLRRPSEDLEGK
jgi:3-hydroxybutyryl-CoA dehydrogenase